MGVRAMGTSRIRGCSTQPTSDSNWAGDCAKGSAPWAIANSPDASLPEQMTNWGDLKAAYRLLNCEDRNHTTLSQPHWKKTCEFALSADSGVVLFIQDTSELDYTRHRQTKDLGRASLKMHSDQEEIK